MNKNILFRKAKIDDLDFLIEGFIEAEKGGSNIIPTLQIFNLSEEEFKVALKEFLSDSEIIDCELSLNSYFVAEIDQKPVAHLSLWIEEINGISSDSLRAALWYQYLGKDRFDNLLNNLELAKKYSLKRVKNFLQCEYLYVLPSYRKGGILKKLLKYSLTHDYFNLSEISGLQTMLFMENVPSYKFFSSRNFIVNEKTKIGPDALGILFGYETKVSMILNNSQISDFISSL